MLVQARQKLTLISYKSLITTGCISVLCSLFSTPVFAHHGYLLHFDPTDQVKIEGKIHHLLLKNPHTEIQVSVVDDDGNSEIWTCEMQARSILARKGVTKANLKVGDTITIDGARARKTRTECEAGMLYLADGKTVELRSPKGRANVAVNKKPAENNTSVFGSWIRVTFTGIPVKPSALENITAAGKAANEMYDPFADDPTIECRPGNPVRAWAAPGEPTEIRREGDHVIIQHEFMDTTRRILMEQSKAPVNITPSEMGFSVGRMEGDDLVIETRHFSNGVLLTHVKDSGITHSDQMLLIERYHFDQETGQLEYNWEASDPLYFGENITGGLVLFPSELEIEKFDCEKTY